MRRDQVVDVSRSRLQGSTPWSAPVSVAAPGSLRPPAVPVVYERCRSYPVSKAIAQLAQRLMDTCPRRRFRAAQRIRDLGVPEFMILTQR